MEFITGDEHSEAINELWLRGGFPDSLLAMNDETNLNWRYDFFRTYLERDIPQLGPRIPAETLGRFWTMLAHSQGTNIKAAKFASNLDVSSVTVARYIDLLVDLLLIRKIQPYTVNIKKRLVKSPRIYVRDSRITHALVNIGSYSDLLRHPIVGKSWEGFVIENIISILPSRVRPYYYRTASGAEIDPILEFGIDEKWAIENKKGSSFSMERGFHEDCDDIEPDKKFIIYGGSEKFPLRHEVTAINLYEFLVYSKQDNI